MYADDYTVSYSHRKADVLKYTLYLINWFHNNKTKANPDKFQAISMEEKSRDLNLTFQLTWLRDTTINTEPEVKLLGVTIHFQLDFDSSITDICIKKWLRYQRVISLKKPVGNTNQINKWANTDPRIYRRWDQVPRRSKHPLLAKGGETIKHFEVDRAQSYSSE
jgi:hypothetical protein